MRVGLIGAKLQGRRRASSIQSFPSTELAVISSAPMESARALADKMGCEAVVGWEHVIQRSDLDAVVVCTPPHLHAQISIAAMKSGKHVLCEKPLARTLQEAKAMVEVAKANRVKLKCGFNLRHHPAIQRARELLHRRKIGGLSFIRCRYGICGRLGYEREWRASPEIVGGGQLMEQGIHAIDLSRWFLGEFADVAAFTANYFWKTEPLEDNAFILLRTEDGKIASIHSSLTQWKNLFSFEIFGYDGYIAVEGLGGSYGTERLVLGRREFLKPFAEEVIEFRGGDSSWYEEWKEFVACIEEDREPSGSGDDGLVAMRLVHAAYESAQNRCFVTL